MGNCECVSTQKCDFGDKDESNPNPKLKILSSDDDHNQMAKNESLISFSTISIKNLANSKNIDSYMPHTIPAYDRQGNLSKSSRETLLSEQLQSYKQGESIPQIEINTKLSLKQFYDLKKLIEKINHTLQELNIKKACVGYQRADVDKIYDQNFMKIYIKTEQLDQIGFYRGETKQYYGKLTLNGQGELYFASGAYYNGTFHKNHFHKTGIFIHPDKDYYFGTWKKNKACGFGQFHHYQGVIYKGEWTNDAQSGIGEQYWPDGAYFRGYFSQGNKKSGKFQWPDKSSYCGQFVNNKFEGKGKWVWQDKRCYDGSWKNNLMHGYGVFSWPNGQIFKGMYQNQKKQGAGELILADGTQIKGNWINGKLQGMTKVTKDGKTTTVQWKNGVQV